MLAMTASRSLTLKANLFAVGGEQDHEEGEFNFPTEIAVSGNLVYVADSGNQRIQVFTAEGDGFIRTLGRDRI